MKTKIANSALILSIILIIFVVIIGIINKNSDNEITTTPFESKYDDDYVYHVNSKTIADFSEPIIQQFAKESQLVVSSVDASINVQLKQTGFLDIGALNKTQDIKYKGTGRFYIDLSGLSEESIDLDEETKTITVSIPHTEMLPIEIDPNCFESEDAKKGFLAFGDLKFTPKEFNDLEVECKTKITKAVNTKENRLKADENAIDEIIKIYEPIIKAVDDSYSINVIFSKEDNPTE